ncbi:MAG: EscU/YscU/HrcU family type III secretion system export apparatus switch protein [Anaerotignum sp.]
MSKYKENLGKKAVALKYDADQVAPIIVASGMGHMAEKLIEVASDNNIPVYEDSSLATILSRLELGAEIPEELYKAIVDIYVYFLNFSPSKPTKNVDSAQEK